MLGFLYGQTEYNILESSVKLDDYIAKAKEYGYEMLSITDSNLYGHLKFYNLCLKNNIKPLIGLKLPVLSSDNENNFLLAYAINDIGYQALLKLSTLMKLEDKVFSLDELSYYQGLIFISTDESDIYRLALNADELILEETLTRYQNKLNFGVGLTLNSPANLHAGTILRDLSHELGYKIYPLIQTLYLDRNDREVYEALSSIGKNNIKKGEYFFKNKLELEEEFYLFDEVFINLADLVSKVDVTIKPVLVSLPKYPNTNGMLSHIYLKQMTEKGLVRRFQKAHAANFDAYARRLDHELTVIHEMGYDDYFLIVWDFVRFAKKSGIMVGPGRGSAAGSLVAYCLGITNVDPIRYNLFFERFLSKERVTMPDIDMDFPDDRRDEVITYVRDLYGKGRVCNISTFGTFQLKSSLRDLGKVLGLESKEIDVIVKIAASTDDYERLISSYQTNEKISKLFRIAKKIENLPRHISTHAAGIILSNDQLVSNVPLQKGLSGLYQSQLEASDLAYLGLLKIDFLGLRNLNTISQVVKEIPGLDNITIQDIPLDNKKTYELLSKGDTLGVFQLESAGIKQFLKNLKPNCFEEIVAVLSLYRPGPMAYIDDYIKRSRGAKFSYIDKALEPILKETYGIIVYQEQIMQIAHNYAGLSLGEADLLRRAVSKKDKQSLDANRLRFVSAATKLGHNENIANQIYDLIVRFADYGFNKSHAVAYAMVSYHMAYFKANYFSIFMAKLLNSVLGNTTTIVSYLDYAKVRGLSILKPDINKSTTEFIASENHLIFPLQGVYGVGQTAALEILKERINGPFKSFSDFKNRVKTINQKMLESLIFAGAFDAFGLTKKEMIEKSDNLIDVFEQSIPESERIIVKQSEYDYEFLKENEQKVLGFNIEYNSFKDADKLRNKHQAVFLSKKYLGKTINVIVEFTEIKEITTKKGEKMLVGKIYDEKIELNMVIFPRVYENYMNQVKPSCIYLIKGKIVYDNEREQYQFFIDWLNKI